MNSKAVQTERDLVGTTVPAQRATTLHSMLFITSPRLHRNSFIMQGAYTLSFDCSTYALSSEIYNYARNLEGSTFKNRL